MNIIHGFANLILLFFVIVQTTNLINYSSSIGKDLSSARLQTAIDNSTKFAFSNSLSVSSLDQSYDDLNAFTIDPTNVLDDFSLMMLTCYDLAETEDNKKMVQEYIDGAVLCDNDGYYVLTIQDVPYTDLANPDTYEVTLRSGGEGDFPVETTEEAKTAITSPQLMWSIKYPYYMQIGDAHLAMNLSNSDLVAIRGDLNDKDSIQVKRVDGLLELDTITELIEHDGQSYTVDRNVYTGYYKNPWPEGGNEYYSQDVLSDTIKIREVNLLLSKHFNHSIEEITTRKGRKRAYTVYLPTETTRKGVNPVTNSCLLVAMSQVPFAPGAKVVEPSLAGYTAVSKQYIVGFQTDEGTYEYCYASQLPKDISEAQADKLETFFSMTEAASNGYTPALEYITRPVFR